MDEVQDEIKIARKSINNLRYANDNTLMAEIEEELKRLLMRAKEKNENAGLTSKKLRSWHPVASLPSKQMGKQWKQ